MKKLAVDIGNEFLRYTGSGSFDPLKDTAGIGMFTTNIITAAISLAGIILLFILVGGGIAMIRGAGKSDPKTVEQGKQAATSAIIGFIVVFSAYWIVKLIEQITGLNLLGI